MIAGQCVAQQVPSPFTLPKPVCSLGRRHGPTLLVNRYCWLTRT